MLSERFEIVVKKIYNEKKIESEYSDKNDFNINNDKYSLSKSFADIIMYIRSVNNIISNITDTNIYNNFIVNGILCDVNRLDVNIEKAQTPNLKRLDYMDTETQSIINKVLDTYDKKYICSDNFYNSISDTKISNFDILILSIHISKLLQYTWLLWKTDINNTYMNKFITFSNLLKDSNINITPFSTYNDISFSLINFYRTQTKTTFDNKIIKYLENECFETKINIFETYTIKVKSKYTKTQLKMLRVNGLKDLCRQNNIIINSKMLRRDLEEVLLKLS